MIKILLIYFLSLVNVLGIVISKSQIETCYKQANQLQASDITCKKKLSLSLSLENNQTTSSEYIQILKFQNSDEILQDPVNIIITKSQMFAKYSLKYKQDFNSKPTEIIIQSDFINCDDGHYDKQPTCPFQYDKNNQKIIDSQGYCCKCSFFSLFGLDNKDIVRANICQPLNFSKGSATASCLIFDDLWYSAYEIQQPQIIYQINIEIQHQNKQYQNIHIGSWKSSSLNQEKSVIARIVGNFYPSNPPLDLSSNYLFIPSKPKSHPRVVASSKEWMFIAKNLVTLDGSECNKIGVGYSSFKHEASKCEKQIGSCLKNQIEDFYQQDVIQLRENKKPNFFTSSKGNFKAYKQSDEQIVLINEMFGSFGTMITLEIEADDLTFVQNLGIASIDRYFIENFESFSGQGILVLQLTNIGGIPSEFQLSFNCSENIHEIQSQKLFLNAYQSETMNVEIETKKTTFQQHNCTLSVFDSIGKMIISQTTQFNTSDLISQNKQLEGNQNPAQGTSFDQPFKNEPQCQDICPNFYDVFCGLINGCTNQLLALFFFIIFFLIVLKCFNKFQFCFKFQSKEVNHRKKKVNQQLNVQNDNESFSIQQIGQENKYLNVGLTVQKLINLNYNKRFSFQIFQHIPFNKYYVDENSTVRMLFKQQYGDNGQTYLIQLIQYLTSKYPKDITNIPKYQEISLDSNT